MDPLSRFVSLSDLWQRKQTLNIKQGRDWETTLWELF